ncbi:glycerol kinase GlpK [Kordiimonas lacus]|uniref:Glycerol kinase n=1 Tax=Kordiimonas lacus TaxID=637679 RepID=A0A1G6ZGU2_9PROT|nr:glycerol kinase GlpK [Kordiimonas lacus]SDE01467.1 glycerol kinase [Kordiimonas lacus]
MPDCILAMDQGTTSSRAIVFDLKGDIIAVSQQEFRQIFPADGWVEHDANEIWDTSLKTAQAAFTEAEAKGYTVKAIGITNQRETSVLWERDGVKPVHNAIVWQDRRTANVCRSLKDAGHKAEIQDKTGLLLDPYFSATKLAWLLDNVSGARKAADAGTLAWGTIDSFLIAKLTGGKRHVTDATNASRTSLFNIRTQEWDDSLLKIFGVPESVLPDVLDSCADFGETTPDLFGRAIPILGVAGDQQAATVGQCCFDEGAIKSTYGTGCFVLMNTGKSFVPSKNRLLTTVAYRIGGETTYALEGSIFIAGAAVQWLRDGIKILDHARDSEALARQAADDHGVYMVPAFTGLGAPYWDPDVRAALFGMTRGTGRAEVVRATLESVCFQTHDLFSAMAEDGISPTVLRVDGGMVANDWMAQRLADLLALPVDRPKVMETTALGAAYLAGLQAGLYSGFNDLTAQWQCEQRFDPDSGFEGRGKMLAKWHKAVAAARSFA